MSLSSTPTHRSVFLTTGILAFHHFTLLCRMTFGEQQPVLRNSTSRLFFQHFGSTTAPRCTKTGPSPITKLYLKIGGLQIPATPESWKITVAFWLDFLYITQTQEEIYPFQMPQICDYLGS